MCDMTPRSAIASFIQRAKLVVCDKCSTISKDMISTVDRSFRVTTKVDAPFGGRLMVFGNDFRQVLPVISKASRSVIVCQCLNKASFWPQVVRLQLHTNMRVQQAPQADNAHFADKLQRLSAFLLRVGQGDILTLRVVGNMPSEYIRIPEDILIPGDNVVNLLRNVFHEIAPNVGHIDYFTDRAILTAKNKDIRDINKLMLDCVSRQKVSYISTDQACDGDSQMPIPVEILDSVENRSLPPHFLYLKVGVPIMVIKTNIDPASVIRNGTRLIVISLGTNDVEARIATGPHAGNITLIPKIKLITLATEGSV
ncbi:hypothetical protein [Parasitella parasitica]|uniref:ATP-dependent DNA helicase n=1 Tax=Parasitella parasitica TaxID=35722 RepID=A0A0B7MVC7_9FUNG|nr:hypothetical protein [Parasitella parasitica]